MAAAPAHYIRTIHSSFSAAHPHSAAWAATSASSQYLNQFNHNAPTNIVSQPRPHHHGAYTSISTHNTHMYTHHLRDLTHSHSPAGHRPSSQSQAGAMMVQQGQGSHIPHGPRKLITSTADSPRSRRRSVSIRMPPTYKFDPFADEPATSESQSALSSAHGRGVSTPSAELDAQEQPIHTPSAPYTIQIPPAAQTDIQLYTPSRPRPTPTLSPPPRSPSPQNAPRALSARAPSFTPSSSSSSNVQMQMPRPPPPNLSKVVASILLNRVHAVGKPMRRRMASTPAQRGQGRDYVKSCLSSVISIEA